MIMDVRRPVARHLKLGVVFFVALFTGMFLNRLTLQGSDWDSPPLSRGGNDVTPRDPFNPDLSGGSLQLQIPQGPYRVYPGPSLQQQQERPASLPPTTEQEARLRAAYATVPAGNPNFNESRIPGFVDLNLAVLSRKMVTNVVHYMWCERKVFGFNNYISVRSVIQHIAPDKIVFHYAHYPRHDRYMYNMWFEELKLKEYPFIDLWNFGADSPVCSSEESKLSWIKEHLGKVGGIYVHHDTIFTSFPNLLRTEEVNALVNGTMGFYVLKRGAHPKADSLVVKCANSSELDLRRNDQVCFHKSGPYYPRDAWDKADDFSRFVNLIMYGSPEVPKPVPSAEELVPNIAHMFWTGDKEINFIFYLSCLSHIYILKVDVLYIHGDKEPHGMYWDVVKTEPKVRFVERTAPRFVFRNRIQVYNHMADVFKIDVMMKYGGIYTDVDAVWINPLPHRLRTYDAVASYDWPQMYNTWPDYVQNGILLGKRNGRFWPKYLESMRVFKDDMFGYNGLLQAYKVYERNPQLLHLDEKLQVMCWNGKCHPCWFENFRHPNSSHLTEPSFNWKEAYSFHWTHPTPDELQDQATLLKSTGLYAEVGQHVLRMAGKIQ